MSVKRITAICLALVMMLSLAVGASAASNYSLKVQNKYVQFYRGGSLTGSYLSKDGAVSLTSSKGDLARLLHRLDRKVPPDHAGQPVRPERHRARFPRFPSPRRLTATFR